MRAATIARAAHADSAKSAEATTQRERIQRGSLRGWQRRFELRREARCGRCGCVGSLRAAAESAEQSRPLRAPSSALGDSGDGGDGSSAAPSTQEDTARMELACCSARSADLNAGFRASSLLVSMRSRCSFTVSPLYSTSEEQNIVPSTRQVMNSAATGPNRDALRAAVNQPTKGAHSATRTLSHMSAPAPAAGPHASPRGSVAHSGHAVSESTAQIAARASHATLSARPSSNEVLIAV